MASDLPATPRELMEQLVTERWVMFTMDTDVDHTTGIGSSAISPRWERVLDDLAYAAARLAGDGFEGEPDTRGVVDGLQDIIGERLIAFAIKHRLASAGTKVDAA